MNCLAPALGSCSRQRGGSQGKTRNLFSSPTCMSSPAFVSSMCFLHLCHFLDGFPLAVQFVFVLREDSYNIVMVLAIHQHELVTGGSVFFFLLVFVSTCHYHTSWSVSLPALLAMCSYLLASLCFKLRFHSPLLELLVTLHPSFPASPPLTCP